MNKTLCDVCGEEIEDRKIRVIMEILHLCGLHRKVKLDIHRRCAWRVFEPIRAMSKKHRIRKWLFDALEERC